MVGDVALGTWTNNLVHEDYPATVSRDGIPAYAKAPSPPGDQTNVRRVHARPPADDPPPAEKRNLGAGAIHDNFRVAVLVPMQIHLGATSGAVCFPHSRKDTDVTVPTITTKANLPHPYMTVIRNTPDRRGINIHDPYS